MANNTEDVELRKQIVARLTQSVEELRVAFESGEDGYDFEPFVDDMLASHQQEANRQKLEMLDRLDERNLSAFELCEPDCSIVRHARYVGSREHYEKMCLAIEEEKEKLDE